MHFVGNFTAGGFQPRINEKYIVHTDRGTEIGTVIRNSFEADNDSAVPNHIGKLVRKAVPEDVSSSERLRDENEDKEFDFCKQKIASFRLPMKLVFVEHIFGGEKIVFYFLAEGRVDFRELVKELAKEYRTRIEMRQIGVRDEARLLADFEHCGRPLCCKSFIKELEPVTMKMAKSQKTTLDPSKISGKCGRLMCCLRYEDAIYSELRAAMPAKGSRITIDKGDAEVIDVDIMSQTLYVELTTGERGKIRFDEILKVVFDPSKQQDEGDAKK